MRQPKPSRRPPESRQEYQERRDRTPADQRYGGLSDHDRHVQLARGEIARCGGGYRVLRKPG